MRGDGLAQEEEAVWRHGGVDGREAWQGWCISYALRMDRGKMEVTALAACGAHWECARLLGNVVISKNFLRTRKIIVMHSNERGECCPRTLVDRKQKR